MGMGMEMEMGMEIIDLEMSDDDGQTWNCVHAMIWQLLLLFSPLGQDVEKSFTVHHKPSSISKNQHCNPHVHLHLHRLQPQGL